MYAVGLIIAKQEAERLRREELIRARSEEEEEKKETEARLRQEQEEIKKREEERQVILQEEEKKLMMKEIQEKKREGEVMGELERMDGTGGQAQNRGQTRSGMRAEDIEFDGDRRDYMDRNAMIREAIEKRNPAEREELLSNARGELARELNRDEEEVDGGIFNIIIKVRLDLNNLFYFKVTLIILLNLKLILTVLNIVFTLKFHTKIKQN